MTGHAAVGLEWGVLVCEWSLLVRMTLDARRVRARGQPRLLELETAVRIVTIAALHRAFEHLVMKGFIEVRLNLVVTTDAELRLAFLQQETSREVGFFSVRGADKRDRLRDVSRVRKRV